jgi:GNAT superfamily N-acetyltransferase
LLHTEEPISFSAVSKDYISDYEELLTRVFQKEHLTREYLDWLYFQNPNGAAVGYDAFCGKTLIGHYVCIPISIDTYEKPALLSLNTVVDPKYQGKGLFKLLAEMTFKSAKGEYSCVIGVANKKSFRGFIRHLGFEHLGDLDLRFGNLGRATLGQRIYSSSELQWRSRNPVGRLRLRALPNVSRTLVSRKFRGFARISALVKTNGPESQSSISPDKFAIGLTLDWRRGKSPILFLPKRFKPSPLHLIFKPLADDDCKISSWSFPDFDAL